MREDHHSSPSNAEVKNVWNYTSTPPHAFIAYTWTAVLLPRCISLLRPTLPASKMRHALYWACLTHTLLVKSYITNHSIRHVFRFVDVYNVTYPGKFSPRFTTSTTNPTRTGLISNPTLRGERPVTDRH